MSRSQTQDETSFSPSTIAESTSNTLEQSNSYSDADLSLQGVQQKPWWHSSLWAQMILSVGKMIYYPSRFLFLFWVLEAAATVSAVMLNILLQLVINSAIPLLDPEIARNDSLVVAGSFLFLLVILLPLLSLLPSVLRLAKDVWSSDQLPSTRLMIVYLRNCICVVKRDRLCRCKGRAKHIWPSQNGSNDKENISWSKLGIMIFKCATVYATLLASWIEAESRAFEVFFRIGWYYGLIMFAMWLILSFAVEIKAKATKVVKFPSMNFMGVLFDKPNPDKHVNLTTSQIARRNFRSISRVCLYVFMAVHWIVSLIVGSFTASELGLSIGTSTVSLLIMTAGLVYSYYMVFSSNKPPSHCKDQNLDDASRTKLTMLGLNYPTATDVAHNCVAFLVFVLVLALTLTATTQFTDDLKNGNSCRTKRSTLTTFASNNFDDTRYDICSHRWFNLSIVDLAILADIPYFELNKDGEIQECNDRNINYGSLNRLFPEWKWQIRGRQGETDQVGFYELYSQENNVTVLTVRGTRFSATQDLLQDVDLYTEVVCLQFFSLFVPLTTLLPVDTIADIVYYSSFLERTIYHTGRHYHTAMNNYVQQHSPQWGGRAVITGHSLGGSVGKISGSQYGIRTFAFNSPGLLFSRRKFGLSKDDINKAVVNIAAKLDVVSEVDRLGGSSNRIGCSSNSVVTCHRLTNMICDLVHYCQDSSIAAQIACV